jgi:hypothetical protein
MEVEGPDRESREPAPRTRARSFALIFGGFAVIVSVVIFLTAEDLDLVDLIFVGGFPIAFAALAYFIGYHVSDRAER